MAGAPVRPGAEAGDDPEKAGFFAVALPVPLARAPAGGEPGTPAAIAEDAADVAGSSEHGGDERADRRIVGEGSGAPVSSEGPAVAGIVVWRGAARQRGGGVESGRLRSHRALDPCARQGQERTADALRDEGGGGARCLVERAAEGGGAGRGTARAVSESPRRPVDGPG